MTTTQEERNYQVAQSRSGVTRQFKISEEKYIISYAYKSGRVEFTEVSKPDSSLTMGGDRRVYITPDGNTWRMVDERRTERRAERQASMNARFAN